MDNTCDIDYQGDFIKIAAGTEVYVVDSDSVLARGISLSEDELEIALNGCVKDIVFDVEGKLDLKVLLAEAATTEFSIVAIQEYLTLRPPLTNPRVGEAIAEAYLTEHETCYFPWPFSRDYRNPNTSMTGADLVGFRALDASSQSFMFVFSEVKTSSEQKSPPRLVSNDDGLGFQLMELKSKKHNKDWCVKYLAERALKSDWRPQFISSAEKYFADENNISIFGVLVRDVEPNKDDLKDLVDFLSKSCPDTTCIKLIGIYLPLGAIDSLVRCVNKAMEGNHADN